MSLFIKSTHSFGLLIPKTKPNHLKHLLSTSTRLHEASVTDTQGVQSVNTENVSMEPKKLRKKLKRKHKFDQIRRLKSLREIKKYGLNYHGIDTTKDYASKIALIDDEDNNSETETEPKQTEDDEFFDGLQKKDLFNHDYTDINMDEIRSETYKMEQYYYGDSDPKNKNTVIDSADINEFGKSFESLGISSQLCEGLKWKHISEPTEIQRKVIPYLLHKMDLIKDTNPNGIIEHKNNKNNPKKHIVELTIFGESTGKGKTFVYLLPIIEAIKRDIELKGIHLRINRPRALIMAPTRELCEQIRNVIRDLSPFIGISSCVLTAGVSTQKQLKKLRTGIDIVVGTPQRVKEHIQLSANLKSHSQNMFSLVDTRYVVMDEADVLLNEGFWEDQTYDILSRIGCLKENEVQLKSNAKVRGGVEKVNKVSKYSKPIQIVLASATMTESDISKFCNSLGLPPGIKMINTESMHCILPAMNMYFWDVCAGDEGKKTDKLRKLQALKCVLRQEQIVYNAQLREKYKTSLDETLLKQQISKPKFVGLNANFVPQQTIIFCRTKECAAAVSHFLDENSYNNTLYFGVHSPFERRDKFHSFVGKESSILVATDVAMRGLDICAVSHVILYDFPHSPRAFIHRVGRTGRINTVSEYADNVCKITALIDKSDRFIASAILTCMNDGKSIIDLNLNKRLYKQYPHLKLKTAASTNMENVMGTGMSLKPFEPMPVKMLTEQEISERKKAKKMGKFYKKYQSKILKNTAVDKPRLWWYSERIGKTRTPFQNIKKKIVRKLMRQQDEDERRKLLLKYTTERKVLAGGWVNSRNRRRMKKPSKFADK